MLLQEEQRELSESEAALEARAAALDGDLERSSAENQQLRCTPCPILVMEMRGSCVRRG
jgi:hypothetical protein